MRLVVMPRFSRIPVSRPFFYYKYDTQDERLVATEGFI